MAQQRVGIALLVLAVFVGTAQAAAPKCTPAWYVCLLGLGMFLLCVVSRLWTGGVTHAFFSVPFAHFATTHHKTALTAAFARR
jgi:hypothetical protein